MTRDEMRIEIMAGRMSPDALFAPAGEPTADARTTRPDLAGKSWASGIVQRGQTTFRDGRAVPQHIEAAEQKDGIKRVFVQRSDFSGWVKPVPTEKPAEVQAKEKKSGQEWVFDPARGHWRPWVDVFRPLPPQMVETCERHGIEPGDPRYPTHSVETDEWTWPVLDSGHDRGFGDVVERDDLRSPNGHSMQYWLEWT